MNGKDTPHFNVMVTSRKEGRAMGWVAVFYLYLLHFIQQEKGI